MLQKVNVVVFDFDGTLSACDSNVEFGKYCFCHSIRPWFFILHIMLSYLAGLANHKGKKWREYMRMFITPKMVKDFAPKFIKLHKQQRFGWAKEQVAKERAKGNKVLLVSASTNYLIPGLVSDIKFDAVLTSEMCEDKPWKYKFVCWGENKIVAVDRWAKENKYIPNILRVYSDNCSDSALMSLAKEQIWIDSKTGLRKTECSL